MKLRTLARASGAALPHSREGEIVLRAMCSEDVPQVAAIAAHSFTEPWPEASFRAELGSAVSHAIVLECAGEIAGFIVFWLVADECEIANVTIKEGLRRRGFGRLLLDYALQQARQHQCTAAYLEVRRSNLAAQRLYASLGFVVQGVRPGYYVRDGEDAVVMRKNLQRE
ncbi:MAG: ribosomal protein S18-alanine N-acetyltransferase [candidate division KSB1 bacterium]|nr:ribosomal protein S18-alanine N-acetyltransferase [candidate division KSB1 bacterium]MDZ7275196.1 ribosomal protein S18-alanine N-acetyltransferase [candidate division KSB1 bacterium]MDZ7287365.1 ribosomal protein S18-alanine N-acetyltransferase [candidate division KSB1 bacterium]MDZ7299479.1 ribosomal protein S18-alanine N-acetyltransferase [candidate division KSB1 bacterium]MDZ7305475.1 ribosomal protein S18-alanine N-acetyltransferase [candidate division KSB1 bacterium]